MTSLSFPSSLDNRWKKWKNINTKKSDKHKKKRTRGRCSASSSSSATSTTTTRDVNVLISGGTSGICFYLADELLENANKCTLVVCSRSQKRVDECVNYLKEKYKTEKTKKKIYGVACDVSKPNEVERLKIFCANVFECEKYETHWINGAGRVTRNAALHRVPTKEIIESLNANLLGPLLMSRAAIELATSSPTKKMTIWQFGFSQFGASLSKSAATHKSTKTGLSQLTKSLNEEMQRENIANVFVRQMSPGLSLTTLLLKGASPISKKIFNALAEEPEICAEYIAAKMLDEKGVDDDKSPIEYLTPLDAVGRMIREAPNIILNKGGRHFDNKSGQRVKQPNAKYDDDGVKYLPFETSPARTTTTTTLAKDNNSNNNNDNNENDDDDDDDDDILTTQTVYRKPNV